MRGRTKVCIGLGLGLLPALGLSQEVVIQSFEGDGFDQWAEEGQAFGSGPAMGKVPKSGAQFKGFAEMGFATSAYGGDTSVGALQSPPFILVKPYLHFLVAGGNDPEKTSVQLWVDDRKVMAEAGKRSADFRQVTWDLRRFSGKKAVIKIIDTASEKGNWGFIAADHFVLTDSPVHAMPKQIQLPAAELVASGVIPGNDIPKGTKLTVYADRQSHQVTSPTAFSFDEEGNLYVAETHRFGFGVMDDRGHRYWYLDDIAAQTVQDRRALHEKWKDRVPLAKMTEKSELVRRLSDTDGDGKADRMTVFADGFNDVLDGTAAGVFSYRGKTYFACIPNIYALEDPNRDGVAEKKSIVAGGFGVRISFSGHDLNGFVLGNDGRIYGTVGDRGFSLTTREGVKYHYPDQGAVFRFEPDGSRFEVIHTGLRNPKELAFDEFGNGITVDNNSDQGDPARVIYVMDGGDSGWRMQHQALHSFRGDIGLEERPISPWMTEKMASLRNAEQPAFMLPPIGHLTSGPSGVTYHPGSGFLESEKGRFLVCDYTASPTSSSLWSFKVVPAGAGLKMARDAYKLNTGVTPTDVEYGFDGRLYVADFIGGWKSHEDGRIYSLTAENGLTPDTAKLIREGFDKRSLAELARLFMHKDVRVRQRAHISLASRKDGVNTLVAATRQPDRMVRLHGAWGLGIRARKFKDANATAALLPLLNDRVEEVRAQVAQILGEVEGAPVGQLAPLLKDISPRVRAFAAIALSRLKAVEAFQAIVDLVEENADQDVHLRHAGVMGLAGCGDEGRIAALAGHASVPVRMSAVLALRRLKSAEIVRFLADRDGAIVDEAIRAIHDERIQKARPAVAALLDAYSADGKGRELKPMIARRIIHTAFRLGGAENARRLVSAAASPGLDLDQRVEMLRLLSQWPKPYPVDQSIALWDPLPERNLAEVAPLIEAGVPKLLEADVGILAPTLQMVEHLKLRKDALPADSLQRIATTASLDDKARIAALHLWLGGNPGEAKRVLTELAGDPAIPLAAEALAALAKRDVEATVRSAELLLRSTEAPRRQAAWTVLGEVPQGAPLFVKGLEKLKGGAADRASQLELIEAAGKRTEPDVQAALKAYQQSIDPKDPLGPWLGSLEGGDPVRGEDLFYNHGTAQCMRCHSVGDGKDKGHGGEAGPNLAGVGAAHDRRYLLDAMIEPGAAIAPGFGVISLTLRNGKTLGGILQAEAASHYDVTVGEETWRVRKPDVANATPPVSGMPPMGGLLEPKEVRDLVAYLASLKEPLKNPKVAPQPKPYDL